MINMLLVLALLAGTATAAVCNGGPAYYNATACAGNFTCCEFHWAPNGYGCCPFPNAVCCGNGYTCCPAGTHCVDQGSGWGVTTTCENNAGQAVAGGKEICKIGPGIPFSTKLKNCLIIGDSVSIGYTPAIAAALADVCFVQHSPWDTSDGGVCETAYGLQCLEQFLSSPSGVPLHPDVIMFNWGLHDGPMGNDTLPGQNGNYSVYLPELKLLTARLQSLGSKLLFALTSPMLCNAMDDWVVRDMNEHAGAFMASVGIPTINLHDAVVAKCGPVPQASCFGEAGCFCPHCVPAGYQWLAESTIVPALRALLAD
eukprot:m.27128 g.27128  ORF g.27128 m.27128 type:complete len:313 (-) comp4382_c0_seq2:49-987(-)